jgi:hypothetical protein
LFPKPRDVILDLAETLLVSSRPAKYRPEDERGPRNPELGGAAIYPR